VLVVSFFAMFAVQLLAAQVPAEHTPLQDLLQPPQFATSI
jgi:hypothetical protein